MSKENVCFNADLSELMADVIEEGKLHGIIIRLTLEKRRLLIQDGEGVARLLRANLFANGSVHILENQRDTLEAWLTQLFTPL